MTRLRLLPGERELVRLRPSPAAWLGRYLLALGWAAWPLASLFYIQAIVPDTTSFQLGILLAVASAVGITVGGCLVYLPRRSMNRLVAVATVAAAQGVGLAMTVLRDGNLAAFFALVLAIPALATLILTEVDRRRKLYHLTNLRIVYLGGLWSHAGWTVHYDAILDLDVRRSPVARLLGYGTIDPVLSHPIQLAPPTKRRKMAVRAIEHTGTLPASLAGVSRWRMVARLVQAFIQDATASEYLRSDQQTQRKVGEAMRALGHANVLPHRR